ncbi:MlaD family protein [Nocardia blacklockiae]|uniref:MlaD family protein n=1 Tax=Nocardia blacklockiae TaxID=480036 RepID=UPI001893D67E|nr:MCE family protein [Nocardia blacklockiae]MBF6169923.1 MCE family protein [Nocardia blacklockiae]
MILDPRGRGATARQLGLAGAAMLLAFAALLYLLMLRYTGHFTEKVPVTAMLTSTGGGLPAHADVKFRGMVVGTVDAVEVIAAGERQRAEIALKPRVAGTIPANVTARVIPNNLFGVTAIELVDNGPARATLTSGATIAEDTSAATVQLQTTLNVLRNVLNNIQPEKLGRVLATLSAALDPGARAPGSTIERLDNWLTQVHDIPEIGSLLGDLGRATTALSRSAPELVGVLSDSVTTARTLTERRGNLVALLTNAGGAVDSVNALFARNPDSGKFLVSGLDDLFGGLARDPDAIPFAAANLNTALQRLKTVFRWGPKNQMVWAMDATFTPFQQYTAADCPHYGELYGPRCGGPSVPEVAPPQDYPPQLRPRWLDAAGPPPAPAPALPGLPGLPGIPATFGLPALPGTPATPGSPALPGTPATPGLPALPRTPATPGLPALPGTPALPSLPFIPGLTAPAADGNPAPPTGTIAPAGNGTPGGTTGPVALRGPAAVAAVVGGRPDMAQLMLLGPVLSGGHLTVTSDSEGGATR